MTTHSDRAKEFREKWDGVIEIRECGHSDLTKNYTLSKHDALLAELDWLEKNPPFDCILPGTIGGEKAEIWQQALAAVRSLLEEPHEKT